MSVGARRRLLDVFVAALLGAAAFALYVRTLAPTVLGGDGGEFQFVPYLLGVAHPTGYPLYLLLGWAWSHLLPLGDVAYRMNLFSAFGAALAVGLLYPSARALLRQALPGLPAVAERLIAILAAALFAVTPTFWSQSVIAEVYPLHVLFVVLLLYSVLAWGEQQATGGQKLLLFAAFLFGLSLAHHRTTVLLAPALLAYVWLVNRRVFRARGLVLNAAALAVLPLALYLCLPLRAPHTPYLRLSLTAGRDLVLYDNTLAGLIKFVLGGPFGGSVDFSVDLGARLAMALGFAHHDLTWAGLVLALAGLLVLVIGRRWAVLALTGLAFAASLAFNLVYTIGDVVVMYIPVFLVVVLWAAVGVGAVTRALVQAVARPLGRSRAPQAAGFPSRQAGLVLAALAIMLPFFVLPAWLAAANYAALDQSHNTAARTRWQSILAAPLPDGTVLISNDRNEIMPLWYFQYVGDGTPQRSDILGLFPLITADYPTLGPILDLALGTGRPVYLIKEMPGVEIKVEVRAQDGLWRVVGPAVRGEPSLAVDGRLDGAVALAGYDRSPLSPHPGETLQVSLCWQALLPLEARYHTYVHLLDMEGNKVAQSDRQPGGDYYPSSLWQTGERLRDDHALAVPAGAVPGTYRLVAGMYALEADGTLQSLGEPVSLGEVEIAAAVGVEPRAGSPLAGQPCPSPRVAVQAPMAVRPLPV